MTLEQSIEVNKSDYAALNELAASYVMQDKPVPQHIKGQLRELRGIIKDYNRYCRK